MMSVRRRGPAYDELHSHSTNLEWMKPIPDDLMKAARTKFRNTLPNIVKREQEERVAHQIRVKEHKEY